MTPKQLPPVEAAVTPPVALRRIISTARRRRVSRLSFVTVIAVVVSLAILITVVVGLAYKQQAAAKLSAVSWINEAAVSYSYEVMQLISLVHATYAKAVTHSDDAETFAALTQNQFSSLTQDGSLLNARLKQELEFGEAVRSTKVFVETISLHLSGKDPRKTSSGELTSAYDDCIDALQLLRTASERRESTTRDLIKEIFLYVNRIAVVFAICVFLASAISIGLARWVRSLDRGWAEAEEIRNSHLSWLLASVGHDIRSPLQTIVTANSLMQRPMSDGARHEYSSAIRSASSQIASLVDDLYALADLGTIKIDENPTVLGDLITRAMGGHKLDAEVKGLAWELDLDGCDGIAFHCDANRIVQIADNLVGNAIKYTEKGSVRLQLAWLPEASNSAAGQLVVNVSDTGVGIAESELPTIWEPYYRSQRSAADGTGIGLATVLMLVQRLGGHVWVVSLEGRGSTFTVALPMVVTPAIHVQPANAPQERRSPSSEKILIIDDDFNLRQGMVALLQQAGFEASVAGDARAALDVLKSSNFDIVLTDLQMPGIDGYELARLINQSIKPCPILVAMTGLRSSTTELPEFFALRLQKPIDEDDLVVALCSLLEARSIRQTQLSSCS